jgi:hypothetical protein
MLAKLAALFLYYQVFEAPRYSRVIAGTGVTVTGTASTWYPTPPILTITIER